MRLLQRIESRSQKCNPAQARERAEQFHANGLGIADAARLAFAEQMADYFITCDDKLLKRCRRLDLRVVAMTPVEFITSEETP